MKPAFHKLALALAATSLCAVSAFAQVQPGQAGAAPNPFTKQAVPDLNGTGMLPGAPGNPGGPQSFNDVASAPARLTESGVLELAASTAQTAMLRVVMGAERRTLIVRNGQTVMVDGRELEVSIVGATSYDRRVLLKAGDKKKRIVYEVTAASIDTPARKLHAATSGVSTPAAAPAGDAAAPATPR